MISQANVAIGFAWYRKDQWLLLKALSVDSDQMDNTYEDWLRGATSSFERLVQQGMLVKRVEVDIRDLVAWCEKQNVPLNGAARSGYAAEKLQRESSAEDA